MGAPCANRLSSRNSKASAPPSGVPKLLCLEGWRRCQNGRSQIAMQEPNRRKNGNYQVLILSRLLRPWLTDIVFFTELKESLLVPEWDGRFSTIEDRSHDTSEWFMILRRLTSSTGSEMIRTLCSGSTASQDPASLPWWDSLLRILGRKSTSLSVLLRLKYATSFMTEVRSFKSPLRACWRAYCTKSSRRYRRCSNNLHR